MAILYGNRISSGNISRVCLKFEYLILGWTLLYVWIKGLEKGAFRIRGFKSLNLKLLPSIFSLVDIPIKCFFFIAVLRRYISCFYLIRDIFLMLPLINFCLRLKTSTYEISTYFLYPSSLLNFKALVCLTVWYIIHIVYTHVLAPSVVCTHCIIVWYILYIHMSWLLVWCAYTVS